ncbi:AraC family transcriptional regulator [Desulfogranum japonicum]|uniref:AraC family transcriptional regulator n=1 Tax=Desulfogranum japonicum TaxID=231447 RepID=UPI00041E378C|nr:helix-turn-helix transcriptional regulator [Desulfogranum japonicum]
MKHTLYAPFNDSLPVPLFLRTTLMPNDAIFPEHTHPWGEFVYSHNGVVQVMVKEKRYLVPPQYGIWIPPYKHHLGLNRREVLQSSLYVTNELCCKLPSESLALLVSPFMRSILEHARESTQEYTSQRYLRLLTVFLDELTEAPRAGTFLPASDDPVLQNVLNYLEKHPSDNRSVNELAQEARITERTLARKCRQDLGMPLTEWRNRMRVVNAIAMIEEGKNVETVASEFGYSSASAFIAMFKRLTGATPASYRGD